MRHTAQVGVDPIAAEVGRRTDSGEDIVDSALEVARSLAGVVAVGRALARY